MAIQLLVAARRKLLELLDQIVCVSAVERQRQVLADLPIIPAEPDGRFAFAAAALQVVKPCRKALPALLMALLEQILLHADSRVMGHRPGCEQYHSTAGPGGVDLQWRTAATAV
jgi:hypothetical protein